MALKSSIEWTESTWNPVTGCTKISEGCRYCYAERMALRLQAMRQKNYTNGFELTVHEELLDRPLQWKKPQMIFVNSMSDLFHEDLSFKIIKRIYKVMNDCHWHTFQILTKRSHILAEYHQYLNWTTNIWMGVTVESHKYVHRIDDLRNTGAKTKFISFEPLLSKVEDINLDSIDWVIVGGESGPKARPMQEEWIIHLKDLCISQNKPFFFKQWGGLHKKKNGRLLQNREWNEMPAVANFS